MKRKEYKEIGQFGNLKVEERLEHDVRIGGYIKVTNISTGEFHWKEWKHWEDGTNNREYVLDMLINFMLK